HISMAVVFAARGFGRRYFQIGIAHEFIEERGIAAALRGEFRIFVKAQAATREVRDEGVNEHVCWASIEGEDLLRLAGARKNSDVRFGDKRNLRQAARAASPKSSPKRKFNWLSSPALMGSCSATRRISLRSASGNLTDEWLRSLAFRFGGAPEMRANATSIPSADVPDIMPSTSMGFWLMKFVFSARQGS